jgi:Transmembrane amino acid transporter protein
VLISSDKGYNCTLVNVCTARSEVGFKVKSRWPHGLPKISALHSMKRIAVLASVLYCVSAFAIPVPCNPTNANGLRSHPALQQWLEQRSTTTTRAALALRGGAKQKQPFVAASTAAGNDNDDAAAEQGGTSSMTASTFNLAKNIIGGGMLALPAGMAAGSGTGFVPAIALMTGTCLLSAYTFVLVGKSVAHTRAKSFKDLWAKTIGEDHLFI